MYNAFHMRSHLLQHKKLRSDGDSQATVATDEGELLLVYA